jgi:Protein of unknown function (DUF1360)
VTVASDADADTGSESESPLRRVADVAAAERDAYAHGSARPLGSYGVLVGIYSAAVAGFTIAVRRRRTPLPDRMAWGDLALVSVATHRLSRLISKDSVTAVLRAPVTRFEEAAGDGEVNESPRGSGFRHAVGELATCPFCTAQWIATGFAFGIVLAPRATRLTAATLAAVTASDWLHFGYAALRKTENSDS